ncbi:MAG TPA: C40 family peptidase [Streptosporangiaceae bacterium]|nr:C40 family peptidase [Streptosporangiaceae bacterium]
MRCWARRLLPVFAFLLVLGLILTGEFGQPGSPQALRHQHSVNGAALPAGTARGPQAVRETGISTTVGAIPGGPAGQQPAGSWPASTSAVAAKPLPYPAGSSFPTLNRLLQPDLLVVAPGVLPASLLASIRKLGGVVAAVPVDAGRIRVNGVFVNVLGVSPSAFRPFAARPTARSATLWQNIAAGGMAISYTMGKQAKLQLTKPVQVTGSRTLTLPVAGFGTVGIGGVDAVVSDQVARLLGLPAGNAIVISAPHARLAALMTKIKARAPAQAAVAALVTQMTVGNTTVTSAAAGSLGLTAGQGPGLTTAELVKFLAAAKSRVGMPYVWGGDGPNQFDCSGLVQWSLAQAGVVMPRVAADQARTGPLLPLSAIQPGDLLFYHTDPTAPSYISHVAIYLGDGQMLQAPEPGMDVQIVAADFGAGFAGAIRIYPKVAAAVARNLAG